VTGPPSRSRPFSPSADDGDRLVGELYATVMAPASLDQFHHSFCVVLRRGCLPGLTVEPSSVGGETLSLEERGPYLFMVRADELEVVGELVE